MAEISRIDPQFNKDSFLKECEFEIIPAVLEVSCSRLMQVEIDIKKAIFRCVFMANKNVLLRLFQAFLKGDLEILKDWCHEPVSKQTFSFCFSFNAFYWQALQRPSLQPAF